MKRLMNIVGVAVIVALTAGTAHAVDRFWADIGTDFNTAANWGGTEPNAADRAIIQNVADTPTVNQPNVSVSTTVLSVMLSQNGTIGGVTLSGDAGTALTVMSTASTIASGAIVSGHNGTGSSPNFVTVDIILGAASGANQSFLARNQNIPLLTISGNVSSTNTVGLFIPNGTNNINGVALTGCNTFTGDLYFTAVLQLNSIGNIGAASSAGAGSLIRIGNPLNTSTTWGTLYYTGIGNTSNKTFDFGHGAGNKTIRHTGASGLMKFEGPVVLSNTVAGATILNFGALNAGAGIEIQGNLTDTAGGATQVRIRNNNAGIVTFSGNNTYSGTTEIGHGSLGAGGTLLVNGNHTGAGAYTQAVNSSVAPFLGGSGIITMAGNTNFTVVSGGGLTPGGNADGTWSAGTLTMDLNAGTFSLATMRANNAGRLIFDLAAPGASDKVLLGADTVLSIGAVVATTGALEASDFTFNLRPGFTAGTYTLFETSQTILGGLSTGAGLLDIDFGSGFTGTLSLSGDNTDIILSVIPEPGTIGIALGGLALVLLRRRSRG